VPAGRWAPLVDEMGWRRLMPSFRPAAARLGAIRPALARRFGLSETIGVLTGAHDSSANFLRYLAGGIDDFTLVSTGTWVVALSRQADVDALQEARGMTINADTEGRPVGGALTMGGREFSAITGPGWSGGLADPAVLAGLVARGTMALPTFGDNAGQFPGSAGRGRIVGPPPQSVEERSALAVLHMALLTVECAEALAGGRRLVLDGTFLRDPAYAGLVAALCPDRPVECSDEAQGVAAGAALLGLQALGRPLPRAELHMARPLELPGLLSYFRQWRAQARLQGTDEGC